MDSSAIVGIVFGAIVGVLSAAVLLQTLRPHRRGTRPAPGTTASLAFIGGMLVLWTGGGAAGWATGFVFTAIDRQRAVGWYAAALGLVVFPVGLALIGAQAFIIGMEWQSDVNLLRKKASK